MKLFTFILVFYIFFVSCYERTINSKKKSRTEIKLKINNEDEVILKRNYISLYKNGRQIVSASKKNFKNQITLIFEKKFDVKQKGSFIENFKAKIYLAEVFFTYKKKAYFYINKKRGFSASVERIGRQFFYKCSFKMLPYPANPKKNLRTEVLFVHLFFTSPILKNDFPF